MKGRGFALALTKQLLSVFAIIVALLPQPARAQIPDVALLVQKTPERGGLVIPNVGVHEFALDSQITLTAVPEVGFEFVCWLGDVVDPTASRTVTYLNKPKIIIAVFEQVRYDQVLSQAGFAGGMTGGASPRGLFAVGGSFAPAGGSHEGGTIPPTEGDDPTPPEPPGPPEPPEPPVPEPATMALMGLGSLLAFATRRANRQP